MRRTPFAFIASFAVAATLTAAPALAVTAPQETRLSAQLSTKKISIGQSVTVSGRLEVKGPSGWSALANEPVDVYVHDAQVPGPAHVTTDAQGAYSYRITEAPGSVGKATIVAVFNGSEAEGYASAGSPGLTLTVPVTRSFSGGEISTDPYGSVMLAGGLHPDLKRGAPVRLEFSRNGKDHWKSMSVARADRYGSFRTKARLGESGYWRNHYLGDADNYPWVGTPYENLRWNTHFIHVKAGRSGSKVKIGGTLVRYFSANRKGGFAHQPVKIIFRFRGKKTWYLVGTVKTNAKGAFSARVKRYGAGYYLAIFQGTDDTWASESSTELYVRSVPADGATSMSGPATAPLLLPPVHTMRLGF